MRAVGLMPMFAAGPVVERIGREQAFEEAIFLGLRMNEGIEIDVAAAAVWRRIGEAMRSERWGMCSRRDCCSAMARACGLRRVGAWRRMKFSAGCWLALRFEFCEKRTGRADEAI